MSRKPSNRLTAREAGVAARALRAYMAGEWGAGDAQGENDLSLRWAESAEAKLSNAAGPHADPPEAELPEDEEADDADLDEVMADEEDHDRLPPDMQKED